MECDIFPFSALTPLVGRQEGYPACRKLDVGLLVMIWLELCMFYRSRFLQTLPFHLFFSDSIFLWRLFQFRPGLLWTCNNLWKKAVEQQSEK